MTVLEHGDGDNPGEQKADAEYEDHVGCREITDVESGEDRAHVHQAPAAKHADRGRLQDSSKNKLFQETGAHQENRRGQQEISCRGRDGHGCRMQYQKFDGAEWVPQKSNQDL